MIKDCTIYVRVWVRDLLAYDGVTSVVTLCASLWHGQAASVMPCDSVCDTR